MSRFKFIEKPNASGEESLQVETFFYTTLMKKYIIYFLQKAHLYGIWQYLGLISLSWDFIRIGKRERERERERKWVFYMGWNIGYFEWILKWMNNMKNLK